jgi:hypothetical protein
MLSYSPVERNHAKPADPSDLNLLEPEIVAAILHQFTPSFGRLKSFSLIFGCGCGADPAADPSAPG